MKYCPVCRRCYEGTFSLCSYDQAELVQSRVESRLIARKYGLDRLLSDEGNEIIYAGRHLETDRPVAIKIIFPDSTSDPEAVKCFRREAHAISLLNTRIDNHHVAKTYDYGLLTDAAVYVVTELVAGQSLREYMEVNSPLDHVLAVRIARQVIDGLVAAHRFGVVHRNLDPSRILLVRDLYEGLEVKVVDFGYSKLRNRVAEENGNGSSENGCAALGLNASAYTSPEQSMGLEPDARSDIYSFGLILYEMLAQRLPFNDPKLVSVNRTEQLLPLKAFADVPNSLADLVMQMLHSKPLMRPNSAVEVADQLRAIEDLLTSNSSASISTFTPQQSFGDTVLASLSGNDTPLASQTPTAKREVEVDEKENLVFGKLKVLRGGNSSEAKRGPTISAIAAAAATPKRAANGVARAGGISPSSAVAAQPPKSELKPQLFAVYALPHASPQALGRIRLPLIYTIVAAVAAVVIAGSGLWLYLSRVSDSSVTLNQSQPSQVLPVESAPPPPPPISAIAESQPTSQADEKLYSEDDPSAKAAELLSVESKLIVEKKSPLQPLQDEESATQQNMDSNHTDSAKDASSLLASTQPDSAVVPKKERVKTSARNKDSSSGDGRCGLQISDESVTLSSGRSSKIRVHVDNPQGIAPITASTSNWANIVVVPESTTDRNNSSAVYSITSVSDREGVYAVNLKTPCGSKTIPVTIRK